jgi:hypothetical protein
VGRGGIGIVTERAGTSGDVAETAVSARWADARAELSIVVSTYRRPH